MRRNLQPYSTPTVPADSAVSRLQEGGRHGMPQDLLHVSRFRRSSSAENDGVYGVCHFICVFRTISKQERKSEGTEMLRVVVYHNYHRADKAD